MHILFKCTGAFSRIDHKSGFSKYKNTEIIKYLFSDDKAMKLEVNHKKKIGMITNTFKLKNMLLENKWINQEIRE